MENYAIIVDNGGGPNLIYHDVEGEVYTFPTNYRNYLLPGTKVVYQRSGKSEDQPKGLKRMMDEAHYFATAVIKDVVPTSDGNLRATIDEFSLFKYGVPFAKGKGEHWETASGQFWRNGVRATTKAVYDAIVAASMTPPAPPTAVTKKGIGIRSTKVLRVGISSKTFCNGRFQIVTARDGYYLKSLSDSIYYQLIKKQMSDFKDGELQVMCSSPNKSYLVRHKIWSTANIGTIEVIDHGVLFAGKQDGHDISLKVML